MSDQNEAGSQLKERFAKLPKVVQDAIVSADIANHLRQVAQNHKLHVDQWEVLEREVQLTLMGFKDADELGAHLQDELKLPHEEATALALEISHTVFEPIREQLERELEHPEAKAETVSDMEAARTAALSDSASASATPIVAPATPPAPPPPGKVVRTPDALYITNTPSHERKAIEGDPYREQIG